MYAFKVHLHVRAPAPGTPTTTYHATPRTTAHQTQTTFIIQYPEEQTTPQPPQDQNCKTQAHCNNSRPNHQNNTRITSPTFPSQSKSFLPKSLSFTIKKFFFRNHFLLQSKKFFFHNHNLRYFIFYFPTAVDRCPASVAGSPWPSGHRLPTGVFFLQHTSDITDTCLDKLRPPPSRETKARITAGY